jgi:O-antigen/teichoic acid export membrane protein
LNINQIILDLLRNWSFGKWVFAGNLSLLVATQLYPWFLTSIYGSATTGIFAACWTIASLVNPVLFGIGNILGPKTARAYASGINKLEKLIFYLTISLIIFMAIFCSTIYLMGEFAITTVYGLSYKGNWELLLLLSLGITLAAISMGYDYGIWVMEYPNINFKINLLSLFITLTLGLYLVSSFGLLGTGYGFIMGNATSSALRYFYFKRIVKYNKLNNVIS